MSQRAWTAWGLYGKARKHLAQAITRSARESKEGSEPRPRGDNQAIPGASLHPFGWMDDERLMETPMAAIFEDSRIGEHIVVAVVGPLNHASAEQVRPYLDNLMRAAPIPPRLIVDLGRCTDVDVYGLLVLESARQFTAATGGSLRLAQAPPFIDAVLRAARLKHRVPNYPTIEDAAYS